MEKPQLDQQQDSGQEEEEDEEQPQPEEEEQEEEEGEEVKKATHTTDGPSEPQPSTQIDESPVPPLQFDPSRMIGIIRRKSLIKELAATYHQECLSYCQELLELQRKGDEPLVDLKAPEELKKEVMRPPKRLKKR